MRWSATSAALGRTPANLRRGHMPPQRCKGAQGRGAHGREWSRPLAQSHHCASMRMPLGPSLVRQPHAHPPDDPSALKTATPVARALPCRKVAGQEKMGPAGAVVGLGCSMQLRKHAKACFQTGCRCLAPCAAVIST